MFLHWLLLLHSGPPEELLLEDELEELELLLEDELELEDELLLDEVLPP